MSSSLNALVTGASLLAMGSLAVVSRPVDQKDTLPVAPEARNAVRSALQPQKIIKTSFNRSTHSPLQPLVFHTSPTEVKILVGGRYVPIRVDRSLANVALLAHNPDRNDVVCVEILQMGTTDSPTASMDCGVEVGNIWFNLGTGEVAARSLFHLSYDAQGLLIR